MKYGLSDNVIAPIHAIFKHYPAIEKALLYGSRAKGNYKNGSDIDLTLLGEALTYDDLLSISGDLDDSFIPHQVDLSIFDRIDNAKLRDHIERVGVVFYERAEKMVGWELKTLGEVCKIVNGGTPKTNVPTYWFGQHLWITPAEMGKLKSPYISDTERKITDAGLKNSSASLLPKYSIILSSRAPIGHLVINTNSMATNQGCKGLIPSNRLNYKYLYYYLFSKVDLLNALGTGTTFKELSGGKLKEVAIPLAPLQEQQRIVAILDEVFAGVAQAKENAERNLKNARDIFESYLQSVFAQRGEGWIDNTLDQVCIVERGSSPRPIKSFLSTAKDAINWIKIGDTEEGGKYLYSTAQKITPEGAKQSRFVKEGDFILTNSMSFGRPYIMKTSGCIHDGWFVLRLNVSIDTDYFYYLLSSEFVQSQFARLASGSVVKNISGDLVKQAVLPIPPLEHQKIIVRKLLELSAQTKHLESIYQQKIAHLEELKKSVLQKAFSGEL